MYKLYTYTSDDELQKAVYGTRQWEEVAFEPGMSYTNIFRNNFVIDKKNHQIQLIDESQFNAQLGTMNLNHDQNMLAQYMLYAVNNPNIYWLDYKKKAIYPK